jgi:hypothetical protein
VVVAEVFTLSHFQQSDQPSDIELVAFPQRGDHRGGFLAGVFGIDPEEVLARRRAPLGKARSGERCPSGLDGVVEHVTVGEVLHQEAVRVTPVVEQLAALDVAADTPGAEVPLILEVLPTGGQGVEVAHLIGGVHVAVRRAQCHRHRVVVGRDAAAVAADEAHRRAAIALPVVVEEVADDQPEVVEVPVQCPDVGGGRQHHVAEALNARGFACWTLGGVGALELIAEIEDVGLLAGERGRIMQSGNDFDRGSVGVDEVDRLAADVLRQPHGRHAGLVRQAQQIRLVVGAEGEAAEPGVGSAPDDHAGRPGVGSAQMKFTRVDGGGGEPEGAGESRRAGDVGLVELEPGEVCDLDHRVTRPAGVFSAQRPLLAVQLVVRADDLAHGPIPSVDEIVTYDGWISQGRRPATD